MALNIAFVCVYLFEMLVSVIFFDNVSVRRFSLLKTFLIGATLFEIGAFVSIFVINNPALNTLLTFIANITFALFCFDIGKRAALFYSIILGASSFLLEMISVLFVSSVQGLYFFEYKSEILQLIFEVVLSKLIYFIAVLVILRFVKGNGKVKIPLGFFVYPIISVAAVGAFFYICTNEVVEQSHQVVLAAVSVLLLFSVFSSFLTFQLYMQKVNENSQLHQEQQKIKSDVEYYNILKRQLDFFREFAHDIKNHLTVMKNINTDPRLDEEISKMSDNLTVYNKISNSGNYMLDVIIDKCAAECEMGGMNFTFDTSRENLLRLEAYDVVTVLGNLLDNAVEAARVSENKKIRLETSAQNGIAIIKVSNSCDVPPKLNGKKPPVTTKEDKSFHGIGLKAVIRTIAKYNGDIDFSYDKESRQFKVLVVLEDLKKPFGKKA